MSLVNLIEIFEGRVELEQTSISNRSTKVFTLSGISDASLRFLGKPRTGTKISDEEKSMVKEFWEQVSKNMPEWQLLLDNKITPFELRKGFVNTNTNLLNALGITGNIILEQHPDNWKEKICGLKNTDWSRSNPEWEGRLMINGQMTKLAKGIELAANTILKKCGITLSEDRLQYESRL